jgi:transcriptional regulator with XRE-family HTH domain
MEPPKPDPRPLNPKALALGRRIALAREQKGYTQAEVGSILGVSDNAVTQYETGRSIPRARRMPKLAEFLGVTVEWLLTGNEPEELTKAQTKAEEEVLSLMRVVPAEHQALALAAFRGLVGAYTKK